MKMCNASARRLGNHARLGLLIFGLTCSLSRAESANGWGVSTSPNDAEPTTLQAASAMQPSSAALRGAAAEVESATEVESLAKSGGSGGPSKSFKSKSFKSKSFKSKSAAMSDEISSVSQMSLDGMSVQECKYMEQYITNKCSGNCIMFNKLSVNQRANANGVVFTYDQEKLDNTDEDEFERCPQELEQLKCEDYPIHNNKQIMKCAQISNAISIRDATDPDQMAHCMFDVLYELGITEAPPNPPCPDDRRRRRLMDVDPTNDAYWEEMTEVMTYQIVRIQEMMNTPPNAAEMVFRDAGLTLPIPSIWENYSVSEVAFAVFDEPPCYHQSRHFHEVFKGNYGDLVVDHNVAPSKDNVVEFIEGIILAYKSCIDSIYHISQGNFALKWHFGRARPEEVAFIIYQCDDELGMDYYYNGTKTCDERLPLEYVSGTVLMQIRMYADLYFQKHGEGITKAAQFTAYEGGSPHHPSYPAMHSAASGWSFVSQILYHPTPAMVCESIKTDFAVSWARSVAGVHYPLDNMHGLAIGQAQSARHLDYYFMENGGDLEYIRAKIQAKKFDWMKVNMTKLDEIDCKDADAAFMYAAGLSSFGAAIDDAKDAAMAEGTEGTAQAFSTSVIPIAESQPPESPPAFDFNIGCPASNTVSFEPPTKAGTDKGMGQKIDQEIVGYGEAKVSTRGSCPSGHTGFAPTPDCRSTNVCRDGEFKYALDCKSGDFFDLASKQCIKWNPGFVCGGDAEGDLP